MNKIVWYVDNKIYTGEEANQKIQTEKKKLETDKTRLIKRLTLVLNNLKNVDRKLNDYEYVLKLSEVISDSLVELESLIDALEQE